MPKITKIEIEEIIEMGMDKRTLTIIWKENPTSRKIIQKIINQNLRGPMISKNLSLIHKS